MPPSRTYKSRNVKQERRDQEDEEEGEVDLKPRRARKSATKVDELEILFRTHHDRISGPRHEHLSLKQLAESVYAEDDTLKLTTYTTYIRDWTNSKGRFKGRPLPDHRVTVKTINVKVEHGRSAKVKLQPKTPTLPNRPPPSNPFANALARPLPRPTPSTSFSASRPHLSSSRPALVYRPSRPYALDAIDPNRLGAGTRPSQHAAPIKTTSGLDMLLAAAADLQNIAPGSGSKVYPYKSAMGTRSETESSGFLAHQLAHRPRAPMPEPQPSSSLRTATSSTAASTTTSDKASIANAHHAFDFFSSLLQVARQGYAAEPSMLKYASSFEEFLYKVADFNYRQGRSSIADQSRGGRLDLDAEHMPGFGAYLVASRSPGR